MHDIQALGRELQALRREVRRQRRSQRRSLLVAIVAVIIAAVSPVVAFAANFSDLNPGSVHNANINAIADAGITTGCAPSEYCPNATVTREEMASFLARAAGLGTNPPVANAKTAQTAIAAQTATNAINAQNAATAQNAIAAQTATNATNAANATTLQGFAPNGLLRTNVAANGQAAFPLDGNLTPVATVGLTLPGPGLVLVTGSATLIGTPGGSAGFAAALLVDDANGAVGQGQLTAIGDDYGASLAANIAPTWVFQATTGGQRTFSLMATADPSSFAPGEVVAISGAVTATFIPFGPGGAVAAEQAKPQPFRWPKRP